MHAEFILCTNNFRAQGAGGFPGAAPDTICFEHPAIVRDVCANMSKQQDRLHIEATAPFRLLPCRRQRYVAHRTRRAGPFAPDRGYAPEVLGADKDGFLRCA